MTLIVADRVRDTTTDSSTGVLTVSGAAPSGYRTFSAVCAVNDTILIGIAHQSQPEWEVSLATYNATNQLTRTTVKASSNGGAAVNFSAGIKDVYATFPAAGGQEYLQQVLLKQQVHTPANLVLDLANQDNVKWDMPLSDTTGILFARSTNCTVTGTFAVVAPGHGGAFLGWTDVQSNVNHEGNIIAIEGRFQNTNAATISFSSCFYGDMALNAGTLTAHAVFQCNVLANSGSIGVLYGFYFPSLAGGGNTGTFGQVYVLANQEPSAKILTNGPIISASNQEVASAVHAGYTAGRYYYGVNANSGVFAAALAAGILYFAPFFCGTRKTFTKIGVRVTTAVAASNLQLAIYRSDGLGVPTTKVLSTASISAATTGAKEATISRQLEAGLYFLAVASDAAISINWYTDFWQLTVGATTDNGSESTLLSAGTFGTWPDYPTITYSAISNANPQIWMRL